MHGTLSRDSSRRVRALARDQRGASAGEYIVIIGVVGLALMAVFKAFGTNVFGASKAQGTEVTCVALGDSTSCAGGGGDAPAPGPPGPLALNTPPASPGAGPACTGASCPGGSRCFAAGTPVATPGGLTPIEQIHTGDAVVTFDESTGKTEIGSVGETFVTPDRDLLELRVRGDDAPLRVTPGHRFFTLDRGWTPVEGLGEGEPLVDPGGAAVFVDRVDVLSERDTVYNFEVETSHTYFVGPERVLVHNPVTPLPGGTTSEGGPGSQSIIDLPHPDNTVILQTSKNDGGLTGPVSGSIQRYQSRYPNATLLTWENLEPGNAKYRPNALAGVDDVLVIGHGYPSSIQWGKGWISGPQLAGKLQSAGYAPPSPDAEVGVLSCNGNTACYLLGRPSVAQSVADTFHVQTFGASAGTPWRGLLPPWAGGTGFASTSGGAQSSTNAPGGNRFQPWTGANAPWLDPVVESVDQGTMTTCTPAAAAP